MCNFRYPAKSFAIRHQMAMAVNLHMNNFKTINFNIVKDPQQMIVHSEPPSFALLSPEYPHPLNKGLIFKVLSKRLNYWIHPTQYRALASDGSVVVGGFIYELKKRPQTSKELKQLDLELLQQKFPEMKWVQFDNLSHRVDFLFDGDHELFGSYKALIRGVI